MYDWLTVVGQGFDERDAIKVDNIVSGNDGDLCLSFVLYGLLEKWEKPLCIDIGADKGWVSIFCAKYKPDCRILAFEPTIEAYLEFLKNASSYPSIQCYNIAISNFSGHLPFNTNGSDSHSRGDCNTFFPCYPLDKFVGESEPIHFIKIDTEGHEPIILSSIEHMFPRISSIVFEFTVYWYGQTKEECVKTSLNLLEKISNHFGYIYTLSRRGVPILFGPLLREHFLKNIENLYDSQLQVDILVSKNPFDFIHHFPSSRPPNV